MGKRERHFEQIERLKAKYRALSTDNIRHRLREFDTALVPAARIALRHLLQEREQEDGFRPPEPGGIMTEADWNVCTDPDTLLGHLSRTGCLSDRKLRLFAVASCRLVWFWLEDPQNERALQAQERVADDGQSSVPPPAGTPTWVAWPDLRVTTAWTGWSFAGAVVEATKREVGAAGTAAQASVLRDIYGPLPFRPVALHPDLSAWNNGLVVRLAGDAYENRHLPEGTLDWDRLSVLADTLEESGPGDQEVLAHLRQPDVRHVRGCWALDLILRKE